MRSIPLDQRLRPAQRPARLDWPNQFGRNNIVENRQPCTSRSKNFRRARPGIYTYVNNKNPFGKRLPQDRSPNQGNSTRSGQAARLREFRERGFAALAQSVESVTAGDAARKLETLPRLAPLPAHGEQLTAVEVDARDRHAVSAQLPVRRRGLEQRGCPAGSPEFGGGQGGKISNEDGHWGPSPARKDLNIDFGEKDAGEGRLSAVAGGVARGNRPLYETDTLRDAPGLDEGNAARTFEHTVERAQALKLDVERLELRKSFSRVAGQDCGDRFDNLALEPVERAIATRKHSSA